MTTNGGRSNPSEQVVGRRSISLAVALIQFLARVRERHWKKYIAKRHNIPCYICNGSIRYSLNMGIRRSALDEAAKRPTLVDSSKPVLSQKNHEGVGPYQKQNKEDDCGFDFHEEVSSVANMKSSIVSEWP